MPAHDTANSVIASANRLIDVRHVCFSSSRIAEISVPAWPIPIHQTKLVISNAQPIGMFSPQIPIPLANKYVTERKSRNIPTSEIPNATNHDRGVCLVRTIELILSVIEEYVASDGISGVL